MTEQPQARSTSPDAKGEPSAVGDRAHRAAQQQADVERANPLSETVLGYRRQSLAKAKGVWEEYEKWLDAVANRVEKVQVIRQSSRNRREYAKHFETATAYREADPDVAAVRRLDVGDLLEGAVAGMPAFRIEKRHLRGGGRSTAYVGTAVVVGTTLFLFILNSAVENNLKDDHEDQAGNAFTAAVPAAVRRLSYKRWADDITSRLWVHFPDKSRLCRDERHAINLVDTLAWAGVILRLAEQEFPNLDEGSAKLVLSIFLSVSVQELENIVLRLFNARLGTLRAGQWLGQEAPPISHRIASELMSDGRQQWVEENVHALTLREDAVEMMTRLVDKILTSAGDKIELGPKGFTTDPKAIPDWQDVAKLAGTELGVESRDFKHMKRGGLPVHKLADGGAASIRRYIHPRWIEGWRTGRTPFVLSVPRVIASTFKVQLTEHQEWVEREDGTVGVLTRMEMPLPELTCDDDCVLDGHVDDDGTHLTHGFGIPDWKWDRVRELLERTARRSGEHSPHHGNGPEALRYPFTSTFAWDGDGRQFKLLACRSKVHGSVYQLYTRDAAPDPTRAWKKGPDEVCMASFVASEFATELGKDLELLLRNVDRSLLALTVVEPSRDDGSATDPIERAEAALAQAVEARVAAEEEAKRATRIVLFTEDTLRQLTEQGSGDKERKKVATKLLVAEEVLAENETKLSEAVAAVARYQAQVVTVRSTKEKAAVDRAVTVDLSRHLVVAKALQKASGATLRVLNDCVLQMLDGKSSRIEVPADDHTKIVVRPTWQFISAETNEVLTYQRTVHIKRLPPNPQTKTKNVDLSERDQKTIPRMLLHEGLSRVEVSRRFGIAFTPGDSHAYGYQIIGTWLDAHGVTRKLHQPLLDAAPVARRALYLALTGDQAGIDGLLARQGVGRDYIDLMVARYTAGDVVTRSSWPSTWVPSDHVEDRAVVRALVSCGGSATIEELSNVTGLSHKQVARTAHKVPASQRGGASPRFAQLPIVLKGEWRGVRSGPLAGRELWLLACPHEDCDGYVTQPLWTPETDPRPGTEHQYAALCPDCRRTPWSTVRYPADYLRRWAGPVGRSGGPDTRKTTVVNAAPVAALASVA